MTNIQKQPMTAKSLFAQDNVKTKFQEILGSKSTSFITSVLQIVSQSDKLVNADPQSVMQAAAMAATLDLPLNNNLGFAYIVPYNEKKDGQFRQVAQFQMGYKGFIQLAQRSGQFKTISATPIYEGQLVDQNPLTGFVFDFTKKTSDKIIGYASYFALLNGFEKTLYMSNEQLNLHGKRFSQTFKKGFGLWNDDFDGMATKTVLKLLLSKYAPLSVDMQKAVISDQALINNSETTDITYLDNEEPPIDKELERFQLMLQACKTKEAVDALAVQWPDMDIQFFIDRKEELKNA